jgi:hypothetical protein
MDTSQTPERGGESPYRVPTRAVPAEIEIHGGRREEVTFYVATSAETHEGHETMAEALNYERRFLPVRSRQSNELFLVQRDAIVTVTVGHDERPHLLQSVEGLMSAIDFVRLELKGGEILEGALATLLPPENPRMSDYFNLDDVAFVPLLVGESVVYVNKAFITLVRL